MGITIHYDFIFNGTHAELDKTLMNIRRDIKDLSVDFVGSIRWFEEQWDCVESKDNKSYGFYVNVMDGCESFHVEFFKRQEGVWTSHNFTKTQWAKNFEKAHLLVCEMLEIVGEQGIIMDVSDEAGYWKNKDKKELQSQFGQMKGMIDMITGMMAKSGMEVHRGDGVVLNKRKKEDENDKD